MNKEILRRLAKLNALEAGGVDNWDFYDESLKDYNETIGREEDAEAVIEKLCEMLSAGAYEPSERGAGIAFDDNCIEKAVNYLLSSVEKFS